MIQPGHVCRPLVPERLDDLAALFAADGITRECWCMWWRVSAATWKAEDAASRRAAFAKRVAAGPAPGLVLYVDERPCGWVQITPRAEIPRFNRARTARPLADADLDATWAVSCFVVAKPARGRGLMTELARAACAYAADQGARAVEAAAVVPKRPLVWGEGFVGIVPALERAGFRSVEERSEIRRLMRWTP